MEIENGEHGKCQFCSKNKAEVPITDGETQQEVFICQSCYFDIVQIHQLEHS